MRKLTADSYKFFWKSHLGNASYNDTSIASLWTSVAKVFRKLTAESFWLCFLPCPNPECLRIVIHAFEDIELQTSRGELHLFSSSCIANQLLPLLPSRLLQTSSLSNANICVEEHPSVCAVSVLINFSPGVFRGPLMFGYKWLKGCHRLWGKLKDQFSAAKSLLLRIGWMILAPVIWIGEWHSWCHCQRIWIQNSPVALATWRLVRSGNISQYTCAWWLGGTKSRRGQIYMDWIYCSK